MGTAKPVLFRQFQTKTVLYPSGAHGRHVLSTAVEKQFE